MPLNDRVAAMQRNPRRPAEPLKPTLQRHPLSLHFGDMPEDQLKELQADIKANGLKESIVTYEGMVLDGWHRYLCLCALGKKLGEHNSYEYDPLIDGLHPEKWVHSKNLFRRQMTADERVRVAAQYLGYVNPGRGGKVSARTGPTMADVAEKAQVSIKTAQRALGKPVAVKQNPTLPALEKKKAALEKQLADVNAQIVELTGRARRTRK